MKTLAAGAALAIQIALTGSSAADDAANIGRSPDDNVRICGGEWCVNAAWEYHVWCWYASGMPDIKQLQLADASGNPVDGSPIKWNVPSDRNFTPIGSPLGGKIGDSMFGLPSSDSGRGNNRDVTIKLDETPSAPQQQASNPAGGGSAQGGASAPATGQTPQGGNTTPQGGSASAPQGSPPAGSKPSAGASAAGSGSTAPQGGNPGDASELGKAVGVLLGLGDGKGMSEIPAPPLSGTRKEPEPEFESIFDSDGVEIEDFSIVPTADEKFEKWLRARLTSRFDPSGMTLLERFIYYHQFLRVQKHLQQQQQGKPTEPPPQTQPGSATTPAPIESPLGGRIGDSMFGPPTPAQDGAPIKSPFGGRIGDHMFGPPNPAPQGSGTTPKTGGTPTGDAIGSVIDIIIKARASTPEGGKQPDALKPATFSLPSIYTPPLPWSGDKIDLGYSKDRAQTTIDKDGNGRIQIPYGDRIYYGLWNAKPNARFLLAFEEPKVGGFTVDVTGQATTLLTVKKPGTITDLSAVAIGDLQFVRVSHQQYRDLKSDFEDLLDEADYYDFDPARAARDECRAKLPAFDLHPASSTARGRQLPQATLKLSRFKRSAGR